MTLHIALKSGKLMRTGLLHCASISDGGHAAYLDDKMKDNAVLQNSVQRGWGKMAIFAPETPDWAQIHIKELGNKLNPEVTKTTIVEVSDNKLVIS